MALTEKDWAAFRERNGKPEPHPRMVYNAWLEQAHVDAKLLTSHPAWDRFIQRLQSLRDKYKAELDGWYTRLSGAYTENDLRLVQCNVRTLEECTKLLDSIIAMPAEIIAHAHDARPTTDTHDGSR